MKKNILLLIFTVCPTFKIFSQQIDSTSYDKIKKSIKNYTFGTEVWKERFNHDFAKLMGATGENMNIGSFASLDLVNPKFNFNGAIPIQRNNPNKLISILSISGQGLIDADNIAYVFSNRKKSTSASIGMSYHFGLKYEEPSLGLEQKSLIHLKGYSIEIRKKMTYDQLHIKRSQLKNQILKFEAQNNNTEAINRKLNHYKTDLDGKIRSLMPLISQIDFKDPRFDSLSIYTKELSNTYDSISSNLISIRINQFKIDSLNAELYFEDADDERQNLINTTLQPAISQAINELFFYEYSMRWWTIDLSYSRSNIFVYDSLASYHQRIFRRVYNPFYASLSYNFYQKNEKKNFTSLVKVGLGYRRTINTDHFNTIPITEEFIDKDSLGTTTRKTVTNYSVYTDNILSANRLLLFVDSFLFFNSSRIGIHIFPENIWVRSNKSLINCGTGIVAAFRNQKKDSPLINLEIFAKVYEIGVNKENRELSNNLIFGIRFSTPFNFF